MQQQIDRNYSRIKADVLQIIEEEMARIANDPDLKHLIPQKEDDKKRRIEQVRFFISACKGSPVPIWIEQGRALTGFRKNLPRCACGIFLESLAQSARDCLAGKK